MLLKDIDTAFLQDDDRTVEHDVDVLLRDGRIVEIGEGLSGEDSIDCSGMVALPGLINCHTHTPNVLTRGWSDDRTLFPWLEASETILERADRDLRRAGARLSAALALETGTTALNDMWNTYLADDLAATGVRAFMGGAMAAFEDTDPDLVRRGFDENRAFCRAYRDHPTVHPTIPVHSVYRATAGLLERAHDLAETHDLPFHIHVSETERENAECRERQGTTPAGWLDDLGVLDERAVLAHCVHLTGMDRERIADSDAGVAHCMAANLKLGSGVAPVPALREADVTVGIGTDSAASNNALNPFREGRTAALVHKRTDPAAVTAQDALDMLTCDAANLLGVGDELGSLEAGKRADLVLVDKDDPTLTPHFGDDGLRSNLVYSFHGQVDTTIVNGEVVVEDGTAVADVSDARHAVQAFCESVADQRPAE